jgi:sodium-dependent dicarboxylate transporter 2/3/5
MGLPVVALMLPIVWLWLCRRVSAAEDRSTLPELGPWQPDQKRVLIVLGLTALAWLTRGAPFGGWSAALGVEATAGDSTVALLAVVVLFMLPTGRGDGERLLDWERAVSIPWGVFIMIGGGMAIGMAFRESNLSEAMGTALAPVAAIPLLPMMLLLSLFATFFTEFTSNTAVANILMPIMAAVGAAAAIDPLLIMVPVTLATNFAFMLPVATAPNAIIYGAGEISMRRMMQEGFALNLIGAVVISLMCFLIL